MRRVPFYFSAASRVFQPLVPNPRLMPAAVYRRMGSDGARSPFFCFSGANSYRVGTGSAVVTRARSIPTRRGCLLTIMAAVVLMVASAETALAQERPRIAFSPNVGSVNEGATADADSEHPLLTVTVRVWNLPAGSVGEGADGQPTARQQAIDALGEITIETEGIGRQRGRYHFAGVQHPRGPRRGRGIRRQRHLSS